MTTITPWLRQHLINTGSWNKDGIGRHAHLKVHPCGAVVAVGLDADRCAIAVTCDTTPLSPVGEALAVIAGRPTYSLTRTGRRIQLNHRSQFHIAGSPAGTRDYDVVAAHVCGSPPLPSMASAYQPTTTEVTHEQPPY